MDDDSRRYRFFISYQNKPHDQALAERVYYKLKSQGHSAFKDNHDAWPSLLIMDQIDWAISSRHFFILIIADKTVWNRPWVQQEIGFALGCQIVPVPLVFNNAPRTPTGMLTGVCPLEIPCEDDVESKLDELESEGKWHQWHKGHHCGRAVFEYTEDSRDRPVVLANKAAVLLNRRNKVVVRQRSALTSFSLPKDRYDPVWEPVSKSVANLNDLSWFYPKERANLEQVAERCDLVVDLDHRSKDHSPIVQRAKITTLRDFLKDKSVDCRVLFHSFDPSVGVTILGDHWALQSANVGPFETLRHAFHTWHPRTVDEYRRSFDLEFERLLSCQVQNTGEQDSRAYAITRLDDELGALQA